MVPTTLGYALTLPPLYLIDIPANSWDLVSVRLFPPGSLLLTGPSFYCRPEYFPVVLVLALTPGLFCRDCNPALNRKVPGRRHGPGRKDESLASNIWINCLDLVLISVWSC